MKIRTFEPLDSSILSSTIMAENYQLNRTQARWRHPSYVKRKSKLTTNSPINGLINTVIRSSTRCDHNVNYCNADASTDDQIDLSRHHHYHYHRHHHYYRYFQPDKYSSENDCAKTRVNHCWNNCLNLVNYSDNYKYQNRNRSKFFSTNILSRTVILMFFLLIGYFHSLLIFVEGRHYIAPGPCTWTHVSASSSHSSVSRDIRLKSSTLLSPSLPINELSQLHHSSPASTNEFDVSLQCSVPILTPFTLNLSLIDPQNTVRLAINCYGSNSRSDGESDASIGSTQSQRSTLRLSSSHQLMIAPFEHLRALKSLTIESCLLDRLPTDTFRGLSSLKNLTIRQAVSKSANIAIEHADDIFDGESLVVEPYSFRFIESNLEHLDLSLNRIETLPTDLFCPFLTLHSLNLSFNHLIDLASFGLIDPATGRLCLQELYYLDLSNNRLELVPETSGVAALKNLQHLNLSSNHISEITELTFSALRRLHVLDLSNNRLRTLPGRMFRDSDEMRELYLSGNGLIEMTSGLFQGLSKLLVLDIGNNQITSDVLTHETFADLIRVIVMDMSNNRLRRLPASIFQNQYSLQVLSLEGNELETIDEGAFATLYNLHTLKLSGNRFRHLPESVLTGLFVLNQLSLANNQLEHVHDDAFKNCTNLQVLDLSSNRLTAIPSALRSLTKLDHLNLSANKFTTLTDFVPLMGDSIRNLDLSNNYLVNVTRNAFRPISTTLKHLRLDGNRLKTLDKDVFTDLRQTLRSLRLDRNEFTDITGTFANVKQLDRLEMLNISSNHIIHFDYALIPNGLLILDLSNNRIETLGNYYEREALLRLEELNVNDNQLKEILATSIPNSIQVLNLQRNRIEKIDQFAFVAKHNVTYVDLRNNSLRRIDNNAFRLGVQRPTTSYFMPATSGSALSNPQAYLNSASEFSSDSDNSAKHLPPPLFLISGNPYYCDCTMEWLQRVNQLVGGVTGSGTISTYPRIGDLDQVECELPFSRQAFNSQTASTRDQSAPSTSTIASAIDAVSTKVTNQVIPLLQANSSNFLCRYRSHCFALCHCCEFDACDCEMMCPENCTCYYDQTWNTNIVDCSGGRYKQVPLRIPMDVTALYLDGNHLQSLNAHTFIGRKNLRILHLNHSMVETIANRSFNGLVYLEELHLEHNLLTALYGYEFESLHYLTTLNLDHNQLSFINDKTFLSLQSLQSLRLNHNQLTTIDQWFNVDILSQSLTIGANNAHHHHHHHFHHQNKLSLSLGANPWSCQCSSLASMYNTLYQLRQRVILVDGEQVRCKNGSELFTSNANYLINQCNITKQFYSLLNSTPSPNAGHNIGQNSNQPPAQVPPLVPPTPQMNYPTSIQLPTQSPPHYSNNFDSIYHQTNRQLPPLVSGQQPPLVANDDENDPDLTYQPIDLLGSFRPKLLPSNQSQNHSHQWPPGLHFSSSPAHSSPFNLFNWFWIILATTLILIFLVGIILTVRNKQDIQLWFYGRYGIRLFESGFCFGSGDSNDHSSANSISSRSRRRNGFNDSYVRDSEKLFDSFVIYARQDESFVTQQLAAELECGYPPYRLCLRYRDLPAPASADNLAASGTISSKDHSYAFDAVTQAIECSRRTLVVITEQFLQSDWCKFELKAAHQKTLTSCKTHRLIVVVVPNNQPLSPNNNSGTSADSNFSPAKQAEALLSRLDGETKTCIRGVTILTWQERRFWEKLRFAMPSSSAIGSGSGNGSSSGIIGTGAIGFNSTNSRQQQQYHHHLPVVCDNPKGRTSTVMVTNCGYPTLVPSSLSSSSSLARSSVLYDSTTTQPIYYKQQGTPQSHHYHYAQLPAMANNSQSTISLHKLSKSQSNQQSQQQSPKVRNPFNTKPLPPPPNQPLPPLPLVNSTIQGSMPTSPLHGQQQSTLTTINNEQQPPPYIEYTNQHPTMLTIDPETEESACMTNAATLGHQMHHQTVAAMARHTLRGQPISYYQSQHRSPRPP